MLPLLPKPLESLVPCLATESTALRGLCNGTHEILNDCICDCRYGHLYRTSEMGTLEPLLLSRICLFKRTFVTPFIKVYGQISDLGSGYRDNLRVNKVSASRSTTKTKTGLAKAVHMTKKQTRELEPR
jgi:hypothetical protein